MINVRFLTLLLAALVGLGSSQVASAKQTVQPSHRKAKKVKAKKYKAPKHQKQNKAKWGVKPKNR